MRFTAVVIILLCAWCVVAEETLDAFDARLEQQLGAQDPVALQAWRKANAARDANKPAEAIAHYAQVYQRVPSFDHALRRQAMLELETGERQLAIGHLRSALAQSRSGENLAALATALVETGEIAPSHEEATEAKSLVEEAVALDPKDAYELSTMAHVAETTQDLELLRKADRALAVHAPNDPRTHLTRITLAAAEGDWSEALAAVDRARAAGLPAEYMDAVEASVRSAQPLHLRWGIPLLWTLGAWFAGFALLLLLGAALSRVAVRAARETPSDLAANATGLSSGVRRVYAAVLFLSSIFYYVSIPLVILLLIAVGGGLIYGFMVAGTIPVKLVIMIVVIVGISLWSMLKSLFVRVPDEDPGLRVDLEREPQLRALLDDVAARIGTRAVDNVYLTPGTEVAVMERRKKKERCLILGVAALDGLALRPFKAVLGHEYGHFINRDTAGGAFALAVRNSIHATAVGIAQGGAAAWYNPAWLFVNGFNRVFLRISEGASRLQEVLADRWAVFAYGAQAFEDGLRHIVERGVRFDAHVGVTLKEVVDGQLPLANLYTYAPRVAAADVTESVEEAMNRKSSPYDSHPTPAERFALVHALPQREIESDPNDAMPVWSLFSDPLAMQHAMTDQVRANVLVNFGVEIAAPAAAAG